MDHESLRTASTYLNNLLLARGLLRDGEPVDFVKPSKDSRAQIINLVHDLILREDRDRAHRDRTADTLRTLRADDGRKNHEIERLTAKAEETARAAAQAKAAERAAQTEFKKAETAIKSLQEQTSRLKSTLGQVRAQCTNDVRKRDLELARLKSHLQGQQRGNKIGIIAPSMTVHKPRADGSSGRDKTAMDLHRDAGDPEYSLRQETTEFLTQLSQSLSDENDSLIEMIRHGLGTMHDLLGMPDHAKRHPDSAIGSMGSDGEVTSRKQHKDSSQMTVALSSSHDTLAAELEATLGQLKGILTDPHFVSIEEVEVREAEITRLRDGWEHMEQRWHDVLQMMESWRKRMDTGDSINSEDLRRGMGLVSPPVRLHSRNQAAIEVSLVESETSEIQLPSGKVDDLRPGSASPKRKRDLIEPPDFFDLRPIATSTRTTAPSFSSDPQPGAVGLQLDDEDSEDLEIPRMTIEEKLNAAREEAEEATARGSGLNLNSRNAQVGANLDGSAGLHAGVDDTLGKMPSPKIKKTRIRGRPRKRKSTLSPDELEALMRASDE